MIADDKRCSLFRPFAIQSCLDGSQLDRNWTLFLLLSESWKTTESKSILVYEYYWWFLYKQDIQVTKRISIVRLFRKNFLSTVWKTPLFLTFIEQALSTPVRLNQVFLPQVVLLLATIQSCSRDTYYFLICFKKRLSSSKLHSTEIGGFCQSFCPSLFRVCASITYLTPSANECPGLGLCPFLNFRFILRSITCFSNF